MASAGQQTVDSTGTAIFDDTDGCTSISIEFIYNRSRFYIVTLDIGMCIVAVAFR